MCKEYYWPLLLCITIV